MPSSAGPNTAGESNLAFAYDLGDIVNSYKGEPTTNNYGYNFRDFTGTGYSPDGEWTSEPTRFTKTYYPNLATPIGPGATLIEESGVSGFHHLSRYGGSSESGAHTLSCYLFPQSTGITEFCIGLLGDGGNMIVFNLDTRQVSYGGGIANGNAIIQDVPGWPGWIRVGANFEGRAGGWVGSVGYRQYTTYTGTAGGKKCYITGIQYEYQTHPTPFTAGTRSVTQGLVSLATPSTIDLTDVSFDSTAQMTFDGTNDKIHGINSIVSYLSSSAIEFIVTPTTVNKRMTVGGYRQNDGYSQPTIGMVYIQDDNTFNASVITTTQVYRAVTSTTTITANKTYHVVFNKDTSAGLMQLYVNGVLESTQTFDPNTYAQWATTGSYIGSNLLDLGKSNNTNAGQGWSSDFLAGKIPIFKLYSRTLLPSEVAQNYRAYKTRFNLA